MLSKVNKIFFSLYSFCVGIYKNRKVKLFLSILFSLFFIFGFYFYLKNNPETVDNIRNVPLVGLLIIFIIYILFVLANFLLTKVTVIPYKNNIKNYELLMLTIHSTLVNFFGPLQSGPGYRAIYLKAKHNIRIKDYSKVTLFYYSYMMLMSIVMLFATKINYMVLVLSLVSIVFFFVNKKAFSQYGKALVTKLFGVAVLQIFLGCLLFYTELSLVGSNPSFSSVLSYTGSANLSIFVAITPGAIGVREAFLLFSQSLHGISVEQIVAANVIDRSIYIIFLLGLFILSHILNISTKLKSTKVASSK